MLRIGLITFICEGVTRLKGEENRTDQVKMPLFLGLFGQASHSLATECVQGEGALFLSPRIVCQNHTLSRFISLLQGKKIDSLLLSENIREIINADVVFWTRRTVLWGVA